DKLKRERTQLPTVGSSSDPPPATIGRDGKARKPPAPRARPEPEPEPEPERESPSAPPEAAPDDQIPETPSSPSKIVFDDQGSEDAVEVRLIMMGTEIQLCIHTHINPREDQGPVTLQCLFIDQLDWRYVRITVVSQRRGTLLALDLPMKQVGMLQD